jgi:DNA-binding CsgD family transcriptional regulator/PAS domain-containing protein
VGASNTRPMRVDIGISRKPLPGQHVRCPLATERQWAWAFVDDIFSLIDDIYEAAGQPDHWQAALTHLADATGSIDATMGGQTSAQVPMLISARTDQDYVRSYAEHYHARNPMQMAVFGQPVGKVVLDHMVMNPDTFERSDFFNEWCKPQGYLAGGAVNLAAAGGWRATIMVSGRNGYDQERYQLFERVAPHLRRAFELNQILDQTRSLGLGAMAALEYVDRGVLVVNRNRHATTANAMAERILGLGDGLRLKGGQLICDRPGETRALERALASCERGTADSSGAALTITRSLGRSPLALMCIPFPATPWWPGFDQQVALIFITDRDARLEQRSQRLRARFGLTPAEAALAWEIAKAGGRQEAAESRGVSLSTARTQLSSIFDKTGVRRQAELVRLLLDTLDEPD